MPRYSIALVLFALFVYLTSMVVAAAWLDSTAPGRAGSIENQAEAQAVGLPVAAEQVSFF